MAYKRKMTYANTSSYRRSQKRKPKRKIKAKTSFAKRVKRVVMKVSETKRAPISWNKVELFHNVFSTTQNLHINSAAVMPTGGGLQQGNRIGDQIDTIGWKVRCLLGQKGDRPNVNWRLMVYSIPKGGSIAYGDVFKNITANVLLDEPNTDYTQVIYQRNLRPSPDLSGTGGDEYTFCHKFFVPHKKKYKFGPGENVITHNQRDVYFAIICYDAFGSVITDNIAYMQVFTELQYKDP